MIPKIIHYCWFGGNPKPAIIEKCIDSWRTFCPDWEIKEWNESNYDINAYSYVAEAYSEKKWAFVSDVVRLDVVCSHGGVYLDTDVELFHPIDHLLECDAFFVFETNRNINTGIGFGSVKGHFSTSAMLAYYRNRHFRLKNKLDMSPCPAKNTDALANQCPAFKRNGLPQRINNILILSGAEYSQIAKHYSTGLWGEGMSAEGNKFVFKDTRLKRFLRKPKYIDWVENHLGKKSSNIYTFFVYDFLDLGPIYYIKRYTNRLFRKK